MIHEEITLAGKPVTLGYCYATEIAFKDLAGQDMTDFAMEAVTAFQKERMPRFFTGQCLRSCIK